MNQKIGRNDPCPCGSGKKYKQCCQKTAEGSTTRKHKMTAKWLNAPQGPNLMERMFGDSIASTGRVFESTAGDDLEKKESQDDGANQ